MRAPGIALGARGAFKPESLPSPRIEKMNCAHGAKVGKPLGQAVREGHYDKGDLFVALDPSAFTDPEFFREAVEAHLAEVKSCRKAPGVTEVRLPGERARAEKAHRLRAGVPVEAEVWRELIGIAEELKVALPADHR